MSQRVQHGFALSNHMCQPSLCQNKRQTCNLFVIAGSNAKCHSSNGICAAAEGYLSPQPRSTAWDDHAAAIRETTLASVLSKKIDYFFSKQIHKWNVAMDTRDDDDENNDNEDV